MRSSKPRNTKAAKPLMIRLMTKQDVAERTDKLYPYRATRSQIMPAIEPDPTRVEQPAPKTFCLWESGSARCKRFTQQALQRVASAILRSAISLSRLARSARLNPPSSHRD